MNMMCDISVSLEISTLVIALIAIIGCIIFFVFSKTKSANYEIDSADIGLSGPCIHICGKKTVRQVAYKIWVEINTRVIGVKIDLEHDIIKATHESYYSFFQGVRELIKEIPVSDATESRELIELTTRFLNEVMRKYLTKWGIKFNNWYDKNYPNSDLTPQEFQKLYLNYNELTSDLIDINSKVLAFSNNLQRIAFGSKKKK